MRTLAHFIVNTISIDETAAKGLLAGVTAFDESAHWFKGAFAVILLA